MTTARRTLMLLTAAGCLGAATAACGRIGPLEQPPPLFGAKAKADYYAARQQQAQAAADRSAAQRDQEGSAERTPADPAATNVTGAATGDPNADNAPLTTRDIKDPNQVLTTPRDAPVPGAPNSLGPTPDLSPHRA